MPHSFALQLKIHPAYFWSSYFVYDVLASPALLTCINKYDLLLKLASESLQPILDTHPNFTHDKTVYDQVIKTPAGKKLELISHRRYLTELKLIHEIMTGYNNCIEKLGMYEERLEITVTSKK